MCARCGLRGALRTVEAGLNAVLAHARYKLRDDIAAGSCEERRLLGAAALGLDIVRGGDWCKANPLRWTDRKCAGRNIYGPTLREAYDRWVQSGRAAEVDAHKQAYLGYIQALL